MKNNTYSLRPSRHCWGFAQTAIAAGLLTILTSARADIVFDSAASVENNFATTYAASGSPSLIFNGSGGYATSSANALMDSLYLGGSVALDQTISVAFRITEFTSNDTQAPSLGLILRVNNDENPTGILANLTFLKADGQIRLMLFEDTPTTSSGNGTQRYSKANIAKGTENTDYLFTVKQGVYDQGENAGKSYFNLSVTDITGTTTLATSGDIVLASGNYGEPGELALRLTNGTKYQLYSISGITAIPEPAAIGSLFGGLVGVFVFLRRRSIR